ncbi:MAG: protein phosphatase 2C domain-containing protein [Chloracidobacterium sp.]|nr:protein phosphatase 2C domain-containing protein [Chloracidobacterium sp.]
MESVTGITQLTSAAVTDRGLNESRPHNEDSYIELAQYGLFAVADGVGGAQAGEVASQMAVEILGEAFINAQENADPEETMRIALERANEAIYQMSRDLPQLSSMATTIAAVQVSGDIATIAHVGDSRVYRSDGHGRLFRETDDHSVVEEEVRAGRMTPEQALTHPSRNVISRALGAEYGVEPDIKCVLVHPSTTFLLCSDGITRHVPDGELEQMLASGLPPAEICLRLKELCFERGAEDNLTAVVVSFPAENGDGDILGIADSETETVAGVRESAEGEHWDEYPTDPGPAAVAADGTPTAAHDANGTLPDAGAVTGTSFEDTIEIEGHHQAVSAADGQAEGLAAPERTYPEGDAVPLGSVSAYQADSETRTGGFGFAAILGALLAGILLGGAGGYFAAKWLQTPVEVPVLTEQRSNDVPLTSFEERRRIVDRDPAAYLNANAATPQEADDYFWLGRALLLTGKHVEAKRAFEEANRLLPQVQEPSNVKTMANEIAMALAIVDSEQAREQFLRQTGPGVVPGGAGNSANSAGGGGASSAANTSGVSGRSR